MNITTKISPNHNIGRQGHTPDFIVLHTTGAGFTSAINTIMNPANQVSYHYVISPTGEIVQAVDITNTAWHSGTRNDGSSMCNSHSNIAIVRQRRINANLYTIGIGFGDMPSGNPSPQQLTAAAALIRHIRTEVQRVYRFDIPLANIIGHVDITPRHRPDCPGVKFPYTELRQLITPAPILAPTVNIRYRGQTTKINATNVEGRFITTFGELAKVFANEPVQVRGALELAGKTVGWGGETNTILVE